MQSYHCSPVESTGGKINENIMMQKEMYFVLEQVLKKYPINVCLIYQIDIMYFFSETTQR